MKTVFRIIIIVVITSIVFAEEVKSQNYVINYSVADLQPQSMVYYPAKKKFIISSTKQGLLGYIDDDGKYKLLIKDTLLTGASRMLVKDNFLYVLTSSSNSSEPQKLAQSYVVKLNLKNKDIVSIIPLGKLHKAPSKTSTDLAIDDIGTIYIIDEVAAVIYKVKPDGTSSILLANEFLSKAKSIVYHKNGYLLVAADRNLYKINLSDNDFAKVNLEAEFNEINSLHFSPNYLLILAEGGNVNKVHILNSSNSWASAKLLRTDSWSYINPNSIAYVNYKIYVLDTQIQSVPATTLQSGNFSVHVTDMQKRTQSKKRRKGTVTVGELEIDLEK